MTDVAHSIAKNIKEMIERGEGKYTIIVDLEDQIANAIREAENQAYEKAATLLEKLIEESSEPYSPYVGYNSMTCAADYIRSLKSQETP